uniref:GAG-pre-integrase domain-containing protein n=1 Tax=Tanacetum cinerariifolium TaxID=118510 RepID=A0A6L2N588_TANCI|nr:hypothetical protein [Tanacetum cinerariifolium]
MYDSWASRIRLFIQGKKHGRMMLDSIDNGPLVYPTVEEHAQTRPKKYSELTEAQQLQDDCDVQATNIIHQGLPPDVMTMKQVQVNTKFLNSLPSEWSKFVTDSPQHSSYSMYPPPQQFTPVYVAPIHHPYHHTSVNPVNPQQHPVFPPPFISPLINLQSQAKFPQLDSGLAISIFQQGEDLIECINKAVVFLCAVASRAYGETVYSPKRPRNAAWFKKKLMLVEAQKVAFQTDDLDAYDSDCDDLSSAKAVLMANISSCDLEVLSEVPYSDSYPNDTINQDVQEMQYSKQTHVDDFEDNEIHSDINIIPVIAKEHAVISVNDDEETLILEEESRSKMLAKQNDPITIKKKIKISPIDYSKLNKIKEDFGKCFVTQKELSAEQAFCLKHSSLYETPVTSHTPIRIEYPSELPKKYIDEIEKINIELEHSVAKLLLENENLRKEQEHLKSIFKDQFDSIGKTRVQSKEHCDSLVAQINAKSLENSNLNSQLQEMVFAITTLKNELRKIKGKNIVNTVVSKPNATLAPGMFRLDIEPISFRIKNNKDAHEELLVYASQTCPNSPKPSKKLVAVTPTNKDKRVRSAKPATSSNNIPKQTDCLKTKDSNKPLLTSIGVKPTTSSTRSKPSGNTKNNMISRPPRSNQKNKVEDHPKTVKSSLNKTNSISEPIGNRFQLMNFVSKFLGTVRFGNDQVAKIIGYGDYQQRNNLEGVDLLSGSRDTNLYIISLDDMLKTSSICHLSKASKTKSWLWHHRLSHLHFDTLNKLAKDGLARVPVTATPRVVEIAYSPVSTSIGQDAPSSSIPSTKDQEHSLIISQGVEESPQTPLFHDDHLHEFLHEDSTSQGSSSNVRLSHTLFELIGRWTKDHPIENVDGDPSHFISTRKQLKTDAMWCYFDAFQNFCRTKELQTSEVDLTLITQKAGNDLLLVINLLAGLPRSKRALIMNPQETQQVAARDEKWVSSAERVELSSTNIRLETTVTQMEETFQVIIDVIKNSTYFNAFTISADVPKIFMQQFWYTIKKVQDSDSYEFLLANKKCIVNAEVFRTTLNICLRVEGEDFTDVPDDETTLTFLLDLGYKESYQMFIKYLTHQIPSKKSRGKGLKGKKTVEESQETVNVSEESKPEPKPAKKKTASRRVVKKKVTLSADDNIIFDDIDVALELAKSISQTKAKEAEATRKVHATHVRIVTESVSESAKKKSSGRSSKSVVIQDTLSAPKSKPATLKVKLKGAPSLTLAEQKATNIMQALKESKKTSRRLPGTEGSNEGTGTIPGVPNESTVVSATSSEGTSAKPGAPDKDKDITEDKDDIYKYKIRVRKDKDEEMKDVEVEGSDKGDEEITDAANEEAKRLQKQKMIPRTPNSLQKPRVTIKSTNKAALKEYDLKSALYQSMHVNKSFDRNPANHRLYHALMKALIKDENAMDKGVADTVKDHKRKHDNDEDDDDEDPLAGPNQGKKTKRRRTKESKSSEKPFSTNETPKGETLTKGSKVGKSASAKEPVEEPIAEVIMDDAGDDVVHNGDQPQAASKPKTLKTLNPEWTAFNLLKGTCFSSIKLEYNFQECLNGLTDKLVWNNPEGDRYPFDLSKPLPLQGPQAILGMKSVSMKKLNEYVHLEEIVVKRSDQQVYKFKEGDFVDLHLDDIKDMLLLPIQHKLFHLDGSDIFDFIMALRMFTRSLILKRRVEDLQLGVESYQKSLTSPNLRRPSRY